jgi:phosphoribosylaminoimidazolecarboxamide formyltransferase/IMP cyclohydrolase
MAPTALLSVSDKRGLVPLAEGLLANGYRLLSSGGTAAALAEAGLPVTRVAAHTGAPEILGGRVKTLHPRIHGGILARRDDPSHRADLEAQAIDPIDVVVVNLYPFVRTVADPAVAWETAIETIDIGGPAMVRAAAKNHADVAVLTDPDQYEDFLAALAAGAVDLELRRRLALAAFRHTADYDAAIASWLESRLSEDPAPLRLSLPSRQSLRYGENPHQSATWYGREGVGWGAAVQVQGKELSYNNLLDLEAALATVREFGYGPEAEPAAVVIKHTNPCGVATGPDGAEALKRALDADRRVLELGPEAISRAERRQLRSILGGVLGQDLDDLPVEPAAWTVASQRPPDGQEERDLRFAWKLVRHVRSNAIVVARGGRSLGIGAGQTNRVGSAQLALAAAGEGARGAVLASDGFFPFDDTVRLAAAHGITAVIHPGGSLRDGDSIRACDELGLAMLVTGRRHFLH